MKHCFYAVLLAVLFISCTNEELVDVASEKPRTEIAADGGNDVLVSGEAYVRFSEEMTRLIEEDIAAGAVRTKSADLNMTLDALGITRMYRLFPHAGEFEPRTRKEGLHRWYVVKYSENVPRTKAEDSFRSIEGVEYIEPVRQIRINDFNDPRLGELWGLDNKSNPVFDINVLPVWENYTTGDPKVIVSVVDAGVDLKHEDLIDNCLEAELHFDATIPDDNLKDDNFPGGGAPITADEHGTHVAGTIAAVGNNGKGVAGIAGGDSRNGKPGVRIMSCQIFKGDEGGNSAAAIKWGADHGAVISQNSWGYIYNKDGKGDLTPEEKEAARNSVVSEADREAIDYFIKYAGCDKDGNQLPDSPMKGGVVIFAAGNDGFTNAAPANYAPVISVGAINSIGERADFSNYGDWVDIAAPGKGIYSTVPGNSYDFNDGTSMACPHVSGVAALIVSLFGGPGFTNEMLEEALIESANTTDLAPSEKIGGLVDAYGAIRYINSKNVEYVDPVTDLTASGKENNINLSWTTPKDSDNQAAYGFMILYGKDKGDVESATPAAHSNVGMVTCTPGTAVGRKVNFSVKKVDFETKYYVKVLAYSFGGLKYSEPSSVVEAVTGSNNAPVITTTYEGSYDLKASQSITVPVSVSDPDGHSVTVTYESGSSADAFKSLPSGLWQINISGNVAEAGTYTAKVIATDEYGLASTRDFTYRILANQAPAKIKEMDNVMLTAKGKDFTYEMSEYVNDPDGDELRYDATISDPKVLHIVFKGGKLLGTALGYGTADVEVKARDARGESVVFTFKVQVKDPSDPVSVYPNPVTDFVSVGTLDAAETHIRIVGQTGMTVYEGTSTVSGYEPAKIDMTSCPPGMYVVNVSFGGKEYKQNIIKL